MNPYLSIIIPAYNEEESLPFLYERLTKLIDTISNYEFEVLFINDGSKDKTLELIKDMRNKDKRFCYVNFSRNFGKEIAMIAGLDYATGDAVIFLDADLQDPPEGPSAYVRGTSCPHPPHPVHGPARQQYSPSRSNTVSSRSHGGESIWPAGGHGPASVRPAGRIRHGRRTRPRWSGPTRKRRPFHGFGL